MPTPWFTANRYLNVFAIILKQLSFGFKMQYTTIRPGMYRHSK